MTQRGDCEHWEYTRTSQQPRITKRIQNLIYSDEMWTHVDTQYLEKGKHHKESYSWASAATLVSWDKTHETSETNQV